LRPVALNSLVDCGSDFGNLSLAIAAGWIERRNAKGIWLCPSCVHKNQQGGGRDRADKAPFGKRPASTVGPAL
jgi:hypothetical protein